MIEETMDPTTWITDRVDDVVYYQNTDGKRWRISGTCNRCGACETFSLAAGQTAEYVTYIKKDGVISTYKRYVEWHDVPGTANACSEINYHERKDIPATPDGVNEIEECALSGEWLDDAN
jgi:hypothetical protein